MLLLMGIIYALAFSYMMPKSDWEKGKDLTLQNIASLFTSAPGYGEKELSLYCKENGECLLASNLKVVREVLLKDTGRGYIVNPDETFQSIEYQHIKIGSEEFRPSFVVKCRANGLFDPQVIRSGDKWYYLHPFGKLHTFSDPVTMVSFMRQSDFLPDRAGYAQ